LIILDGAFVLANRCDLGVELLFWNCVLAIGSFVTLEIYESVVQQCLIALELPFGLC
jgi:hypothetical protein